MTDSHSDFFIRNNLTVLAESRLSYPHPPPHGGSVMLESWPEYLARKAAEFANANASAAPVAKKAKGVEDKAVTAEDADEK
jgi:hypothetical protein